MLNKKKKVAATVVIVYLMVTLGLYFAIDVAKAERRTLRDAASKLRLSQNKVEHFNQNYQRRVKQVAELQVALERCESHKAAVLAEVSDTESRDEGAQ